MLHVMADAQLSIQTNSVKPILPAWITDGCAAATVENAGFASGSALALLHALLVDDNINVPSKLLNQSLGLSAAVHCLRLARTRASKSDLLDAYHLTKPGDERGPGGDMVAFWWKAGLIKIGRQGWQDAVMPLIPDHMIDDVCAWLDFGPDGSGPQSPVSAAANLLRTIHNAYPHDEAVAFLLADLRLANDLGWSQPLPLFGQFPTAKELRLEPNDFLIECHRAVATAVQNAIRQSYNLARRADRLMAIAPKLRAKGSDAALNLFLSEVAVSPSSMLTPVIKETNQAMTGRAARRLCDRLVELGVIKELTGRSTFRLYGVGV